MLKAGFKNKLCLWHLDKPVDGKWFQTAIPLTYISKDGTKYYVPPYTYTDFASVPKPFRAILSRVGKHSKAAVLHDYLCEKRIVSRKKADELFKEALELSGVGFVKSIMYSGVRFYSIITRKK